MLNKEKFKVKQLHFFLLLHPSFWSKNGKIVENNELYNATCFILNTCCVCSPLIVISSECTVKTRPLIEPEWGRWMEERNAQRRLEDEGETKQHTKFIHSDRGNIQPSICRLTVSQCIFTFWHSLEFLFMLWLLFWVAEVDQRCWTLAGNPLLFGFFFLFLFKRV